jgi:hypothetical protein
VTGRTKLQVCWASATGTPTTYSVKVYSYGSGTIPEEALVVRGQYVKGTKMESNIH